ncbi:MAG: hypothetical protein JRI23_12775 [Deltaproteobacteria bacterium]|jgi:hypothetical protein|nr:hypothetical protein [Deltaproteobacteria bacterium]MBW2532589.1 hypothetical protein [Deltaproteobacteria bacterium]
MAKGGRKKRRRRVATTDGGGSSARDGGTRALRRLDGSLSEWRFEPKASRRALLAVVLLSLAGVALGAGVYGQWLRDAALGPSPASPYLLGAGLLLVVGFLVAGREAARAVRVGDLGVGLELAGATIRRTSWHELETITWQDGALRLRSGGRTMTLAAAEHTSAIRRILAEALRRVPKVVDVHEEDQDRIGRPGGSEDAPVQVEPPQVTGLRCMGTDEPLTFEKDVRMCARCGALYHKSGVPKRCVGCGAKLRR